MIYKDEIKKTAQRIYEAVKYHERPASISMIEMEIINLLLRIETNRLNEINATVPDNG